MSDERKRIYPPNPYPYDFIENYLKPPDPALLRCTLCKEHLAEPRFYVHTIRRAIYHQHCASEIARRRSDIVAVPLTIAKILVRAPLPWHLLERNFLFEARDAWWGVYWDRCGVRLTVYICLVPFFPLRVVIGPRLHQPN